MPYIPAQWCGQNASCMVGDHKLAWALLQATMILNEIIANATSLFLA